MHIYDFIDENQQISILRMKIVLTAILYFIFLEFHLTFPLTLVKSRAAREKERGTERETLTSMKSCKRIRHGFLRQSIQKNKRYGTLSHAFPHSSLSPFVSLSARPALTFC